MTSAAPAANRIRLTSARVADMAIERRMNTDNGRIWHALAPLSWAVAAASLALIAWLALGWQGMSPMPEAGEGSPPPPQPRILERHSSLLAPAPEDVRPAPPLPPLGETFRLVTLSQDMAFIEERATRRQRGYKVGDVLQNGCRVSEVRADSVVVSTPGGEEVLRFDWAVAGEGGADAAGDASASAAGGSAEAFFRRMGGSRKGTNQWYFARDAVLDYVDELKSRPERLVAVFDSLDPVYGDGGSISGYRLDVKGEKDFFAAAGLSQGDIVRKVNYIPMTNRMAAESLIRRFTTDGDFDFIVIEIERDGATMQQIYHVK